MAKWALPLLRQVHFVQRFVLGRATIDATGCVRELKKKGATIQLYWTPSVWGAGGSAGGEHLQEVCQAETCGEVFPQNLFDQVENFLTDGHFLKKAGILQKGLSSMLLNRTPGGHPAAEIDGLE